MGNAKINCRSAFSRDRIDSMKKSSLSGALAKTFTGFLSAGCHSNCNVLFSHVLFHLQEVLRQRSILLC